MKRLALLLATFVLATAAHAQTGWGYHAGAISPMTDNRIDYIRVRSTQPILDQGKNPVFAWLTINCTLGGPHPVLFSSEAQLDANLSGMTMVNVRFGEDAPTGYFPLTLERDGRSFLLPSASDETALRLANYDRLRIEVEVHNQPNQYLEFAITGLRGIAESHNCPLPAR